MKANSTTFFLPLRPALFLLALFLCFQGLTLAAEKEASNKPELLSCKYSGFVTKNGKKVIPVTIKNTSGKAIEAFFVIRKIVDQKTGSTKSTSSMTSTQALKPGETTVMDVSKIKQSDANFDKIVNADMRGYALKVIVGEITYADGKVQKFDW